MWDVGIDTLGVVVGMLLVLFFVLVLSSITKRKLVDDF